MITIAGKRKINADVQEYIDWMANINVNYKVWDPVHHLECRYLKGNPLQPGSILCFKEYMGDKLSEIRYRVERVDIDVKGKSKVELKAMFPQSIFGAKMIFEVDSMADGFVLSESIVLGASLPLVGPATNLIIRALFKKSGIQMIEQHLMEGLDSIRGILENH